MDVTHDPTNPFCSCFTCLADMAEAGILEPLPVLMEDEPVHTTNQPFCQELDCPCHWDVELVNEHLNVPVLCGLLTVEEATRLHLGQQL